MSAAARGARRAGRPAQACAALALALLASAGLTASCGGSRADESDKRVIVLGFDGMDYGLTRSLIDAGKLPHLARLEREGTFAPLGTAVPPQSPVAWSDFITGADGGRHGIFDFIHREPKPTGRAPIGPYLSTSRAVEGRSFNIGRRWKIPLSGGRVELLRKGTAFWEALERAGIETTIVRIPANFPPSGTATRELSGMGTPDLIGSYGTFSFFTSDTAPYRGRNITGGRVIAVRPVNGVVEAELTGPDNPFLQGSEPSTIPLTVHLDPELPLARIVVDGQQVILREGEWSDWVPLHFRFVATQGVSAITRFYLKSARPVFSLYASPLNMDPLDPAARISTPHDFAAEIARETGLFYTQGMPEDTKALTEGVLTVDEFLGQARIAGDEIARQYAWFLERFERGLLFYYFGNLDQISHMMWRSTDPEHPAYDERTDAPYARVIEDVYIRMDSIVGETLRRIDPETTLIVMSDHGFTSWRRTFNLNTWLAKSGLLSVTPSASGGNPSLFEGVDWSTTLAYGLGINGLYLNLSGREKYGIVSPEQRSQLLDDLTRRLLAEIDPATGRPAITRVYRRDDFYSDGAELERGPDLVIGYARGTRCSNPSVLGDIEREIFEDNTSWWSGDHCMDHETVPGILATNRPLRRAAPSLKDLAAAVAAEFGVDDARPRSP